MRQILEPSQKKPTVEPLIWGYIPGERNDSVTFSYEPAHEQPKQPSNANYRFQSSAAQYLVFYRPGTEVVVVPQGELPPFASPGLLGWMNSNNHNTVYTNTVADDEVIEHEIGHRETLAEGPNRKKNNDNMARKTGSYPKHADLSFLDTHQEGPSSYL